MTGTHREDRTRTRASQPTALTPLALRASLVNRNRDLCMRPLRIKVLQACMTHWDRTRKCTPIVLFFCQSHTEDSGAGRTMIAKKRKALIVRNCQTEQPHADFYWRIRSGLITLGIQTLAFT